MKVCAIFVATVLGTIVVPAERADARDPFLGEWSGDCGSEAQCWLEIDKRGESYNVAFVAAERTNASALLCKVDSMMERGPIRYGPHETYDDGISGYMLESVTYVAALSGGSLILGGGLSAGLACERFIMQQIYYGFGD